MKFYGPHGTSKEFLASGAPIPDGDYFDLTKTELKEPHNQRLLAEDKILPATDASEKAAKDAVKEAEAELASAEQARLAAEADRDQQEGGE